MSQGPFRLLHVGCGLDTQADLPAPFNQQPWQEIRLDIDPGSRPDIVASITDMAVVPAHSVHAVWSSHNLEHLPAYEVPRALSEFARVLHPAGFVMVAVPDLGKVAEAVLRGGLTEPAYVSPAGPVTPHDMMYGFGPDLARGKLFMAHRSGFTAASLEAALRGAGFASVAVAQEGNWGLLAIATPSGEDGDGAKARQMADALANRFAPAA